MWLFPWGDIGVSIGEMCVFSLRRWSKETNISPKYSHLPKGDVLMNYIPGDMKS
jgi:hypothetical protein